MNTHCNVQCSRLQFAKRLLEGSSISTPLDPGYEGGTIVAEVLDSSDSLRSYVPNVAVILHVEACHLLLVRAFANHAGHSIQSVSPSLGVPITTSNA